MTAPRTFHTHDPRHGAIVAEFRMATPAIVARACRTARKAQAGWRQTPPASRAFALGELATILHKRSNEFAAREAMDTGKTVAVARQEIEACAELWHYAALLARDATATHLDAGTLQAYTVREPMSVVGMIVPWNYPLITTSERLPFALAAGCGVVLKPSELAAGALPLLNELLASCPHIPRGLVQTIYGDASTGQALTTDPNVEMISFVGSTATGRRVEATATGCGKRVAAEMGGNNFMLVYADADLDSAADAAVAGAFRNAGQACIAATHILVDPRVQEAFCAKLAEALARRYPPGKHLTFQPMINLDHAERIERLIAAASHEKGLALLSGSIPERRGNRIGPAVFINVPLDSILMRDEIFGPILTVTPLDPGQFVTAVNASGYGLAAYVRTTSTATARAAVAGLRAGRIWINADPEAWLPELPVGGFGKSGSGRELGPRALDTYTLTKSVLQG